MKQILKFEVELDENNLPENIKMMPDGSSKGQIDLKALMIAGWDSVKKRNSSS